jgi:hypothetical protein
MTPELSTQRAAVYYGRGGRLAYYTQGPDIKDTGADSPRLVVGVSGYTGGEQGRLQRGACATSWQHAKSTQSRDSGDVTREVW